MLLAMGFDEHKAGAAISATKGNVPEATNILLEWAANDGHRTSELIYGIPNEQSLRDPQ